MCDLPCTGGRHREHSETSLWSSPPIAIEAICYAMEVHRPPLASRLLFVHEVAPTDASFIGTGTLYMWWPIHAGSCGDRDLTVMASALWNVVSEPPSHPLV